jgi:hypothetical protein
VGKVAIDATVGTLVLAGVGAVDVGVDVGVEVLVGWTPPPPPETGIGVVVALDLDADVLGAPVPPKVDVVGALTVGVEVGVEAPVGWTPPPPPETGIGVEVTLDVDAGVLGAGVVVAIP